MPTGINAGAAPATVGGELLFQLMSLKPLGFGKTGQQ